MRQVLLVMGAVVLVVSLVVGFFAMNQANQEQLELTSRLQSRSQVLAESLAESIQPSYNSQATSTVQRIIDRFAGSERLAGLGVFDSSGAIVAESKDMPLPEDGKLIAVVMDSDEAAGDFVRRSDGTYYVHVIPLHEDKRVVGALALGVFVYAGVLWMTAGSSDRVQKAKDALKYAVIGLFMIAFAYSISAFFFSTLAGGGAAKKAVVPEFAAPPPIND